MNNNTNFKLSITNSNLGRCIVVTYITNGAQRILELSDVVKKLMKYEDQQCLLYVTLAAATIDFIRESEKNLAALDCYLDECFRLYPGVSLSLAYSSSSASDNDVRIFKHLFDRHPEFTGWVMIGMGSADNMKKYFLALETIPQIWKLSFIRSLFLGNEIEVSRCIVYLKHLFLSDTMQFESISFSDDVYDREKLVEEFHDCLKACYSLREIFSKNYLSNFVQRIGDVDRSGKEFQSIVERNRIIRTRICDAALCYLMIAKRKDCVVHTVGKDVNLIIAKKIYNFIFERRSTITFDW